MKNLIYVFVVALVTLASASCTKSVSTPHSYMVGDTSFSGSFFELNLTTNYYYEKEAGIPEEQLVWILETDGASHGPDSACLVIRDSIGTYGLGGSLAPGRLALKLIFKCTPHYTGVCPIGIAEINEANPYLHFTGDSTGNGVVNIFHNSTDFIQGTFSCTFYERGAPHNASGNFKLFRKP